MLFVTSSKSIAHDRRKSLVDRVRSYTFPQGFAVLNLTIVVSLTRPFCAVSLTFSTTSRRKSNQLTATVRDNVFTVGLWLFTFHQPCGLARCSITVARRICIVWA